MEGEKVPDVTFHVMKNGKLTDINTDDLFANKTVVSIGVPGAFTTVCSTDHVPRYNELAPLFKRLGVDDVICFSVNDAFVMDAWARNLDCTNITMIPDGSGEFAKGLGLLQDFRSLGCGWRFWRHSMLVKNKVIQKMFLEPEDAAEPCQVSGADTMLNYIDPDEQGPEPVVLLTRPGCPFCKCARSMLQQCHVVFDEVTVGEQFPARSMRPLTSTNGTPQVFVGGKRIEGAIGLHLFLQSVS